MKRLRGFFADLARAEQEDAGRGEAAENRERELDGDVRDAHLALVDGGVRAHVFRGLKAFLENAVQHRAGRASGLRVGIGVLHLPENFRFAHHLGIESGGDLDEVLHGLAAAEVEANFLELGGIEILPRAKRRGDALRRIRPRGHAVKLDAVARAEHGEFAQALDGGEFLVQRRGGGGRERELLAHGERRAVVGRPDDKKSLGAHGFSAVFVRPAGPCRLASTDWRESSAAANSARHVHAKRRARSRPPRRNPRVSA